MSSPAAYHIADSPVETLVRGQLWVNILLAIVGLSVSALTVWLGSHVDAVRPTLSTSVGLESGLLGRTLVAFHFLLAAQMSYVILWYRTRSRKDFRGQYKVWCWVGPTWLLFALASAIDGRSLIQELVLPQITVRIWHAESLCWMAPAAVLVLTTTRFLLHDMREDRWGTAFVVLSGLSAAAAAFAVLASPLLGTDAATALILQQASVNVWSLGALLSMLFHARFVIHVTNEAPQPPQPGPVARIWESIKPSWSRRRQAAPAEDEERQSVSAKVTTSEGHEQPVEDKPAARKTKPARKNKHTAPVDKEKPPVLKRPTRPKKASAAEPSGTAEPVPAPEPELERQAVAESEFQKSPSSADEPPKRDPVKDANGATLRVDDAEQVSPKGMSKKQLRKLRKQQRQQQQRSQKARL